MKDLKNLGKTLSRSEQKQVTGGDFGPTYPIICEIGLVCYSQRDCCNGEKCTLVTYGQPKLCV